MLARTNQTAPIRQYLDRIEELEEQVRQLREAFAPKVAFPLSWQLDERDSAILSALFHTKGSYASNEAILRCVAGFDDDASHNTVAGWVGRLRRKVFSRGITITTRTLQGYTLDAPGRAVVAEVLGQAPAVVPSAPAARVHPRGWTDGEDAIVRAGYGRDATLAIIRIELIGAGFKARSFGSISSRAQTLGLVNSRASTLWTAPEDSIVRDAYDAGELVTVIRRRLAEAGFRRNRGAIQMRAIALGVTGNRVRPWTQPEKAIVRRGIDTGETYDDIRRTLASHGFERGNTAVAKTARAMGSRRAGKVWADDEFALLRRRCAEKVPHRQIAEELGRPVSSIQDKASDLGCLQRVRWTPEQRQRLIDGHAAGENVYVVADAIGRPHPNVRAEASRLGLRFGRASEPAPKGGTGR